MCQQFAALKPLRVTFTVTRNLADIFYFCVLMMAYGPVFVRATIHGIILNSVQSLASLPQVMENGKLCGVT